MIQVNLLLGFCLVLSFGVCFCQLQLRALDSARVNAIDDKVRVSLNKTLSNEADVIEKRLRIAIDRFDAQCNSQIEDLGRDCTACASSACGQSVSLTKPNKFRYVIRKLKRGIRRFTRKVKDKVKKFARKIGRTVRKVWRGITRGVRRFVRRTIRRITRKVRRVVRSTIRRIGRVIRRVGRVVRRVGRAIRRIGRAIRRAIRIRFRFRRWGKRNTETLPACALTCQSCRTLQNSETEDVCGRNYVADKLVARLNLIEAALNATHDGSVPIIAKIEFNGQSSTWVNNDMLFNETYVTSNVFGVAKRFFSPLPLPMFGDVTSFADSLATEVWKLYNQNSQGLVLA